MSKLYAVTVQHVVVVLADTEHAAEFVARKAIREQPRDCGDPEVSRIDAIATAAQIPDGWGIPFGDDGRDWDAVRYLHRVSP